ncbi:MAG: permease [Gemmatimonadetes bacterium]|nr:permease [Gemmatimonadota bacterium]
MKWSDVVLRVRALFAPRRAEQELSEELEFHIEMQARKHEAAGADPHQARALARREFGNLDLVKEDARDVRGLRPVEEIAQDVRYALRAFRRAPTFALSVVLTIGLGIGLTASVFTIFNAYVLRPFDVRDPHSLYSLQWMDRVGRIHDFSLADYSTLRRDNPAFAGLAAFHTVSTRLNGVAANGDAVTGDFFGMLGVQPALGRMLVPDDAGPVDGSPVIVLSHSAWRNRFGGDSNIVGRRILLRGYPYQVVGVARAGFEGLFKKPRDFWVPLGMLPRFEESADLSAPSRPELLSLLGRLAPNTSELQAATATLSKMQTQGAGRPDSSLAAHVFLISRASPLPRSLKSYLVFTPIAVAFALVLLLACANVANMMLARGLARQRELGVRLALGASRARLVRQLVTESMLLALPAVALGFAIAWLAIGVGVRAMFATLPADLAPFVRLVPLQPDARVLLFTFGTAFASALFFGLAPSLQTTKLSVVQATRGNFGAERSPTRLRNALVVAQVTVSTLLLIVAAILLREAGRLGRTDIGIRTRDVVSIETVDRSRAAVLARLRQSALVDVVAAAATLPLDAHFPTVAVVRSGDSSVVDVAYNRVSSSYFDVLTIGIAGGREFSPQDEHSATPAVVVSETAARQLWPGASPLGQTIHLQRREAGVRGADDSSLRQFQNARVVGIARNVVTQSLENGSDRAVMYLLTNADSSGCCFLAKVRGDPALAKRTLDDDLERTTPGAVSRIDRLETFVAGGVYPYRVAYWVSLSLGILALCLTLAGVYGVVSYVVGQRTREIGIRLALGATTRDVLKLVLSQSVRHAFSGIAIGGILAMGVARVLASSIQSMPAFDLVAFVGGSLCVLAACMGAAFVPSRAATTIDPTTTLRQE